MKRINILLFVLFATLFISANCQITSFYISFYGANDCSPPPIIGTTVELQVDQLNSGALANTDIDVVTVVPDSTYTITFFTAGTSTIEFQYDFVLDTCVPETTLSDDDGSPFGTNGMITENMPGGGSGDPHLYPLNKNLTIHKMAYAPVAPVSGVYNMMSNKLFQWNSYWTIMDDLPWRVGVPQFMTEEAVVLKHPNFVKKGEEKKYAKGILREVLKNEEKQQKRQFEMENARILFKAVTDKTKSKSLSLQVEVNEKGVSFDKNVPLFSGSLTSVPFSNLKHKIFYIFGEEFPHYKIVFISKTRAVLETPYFSLDVRASALNLKLIHSISKRKRESFPKYNWPFLNAYTSVPDISTIKDSHGLLGQTLRPECPYMQPKPWCVPCFVKGKVSDYHIEGDNLFGNQFKFNKF